MLHCLSFGFISVGLHFLLCFTNRDVPLAVFLKDGLIVLNSLRFCLSVKLLISPSTLNEILVGESNLDCQFLPLITLNASFYFFLA